MHVQDLLRHRLGVADEEGSRGAPLRVEVGAGGGRPSALLADLGEGVCVSWIEVVGSLLGGVSKEADGVQSYAQLFRRVAGSR